MANDLLQLTSEIVSAHVANNSLNSAELPALISDVYNALAKTSSSVASDTIARPAGAITARKSLSDPAKIISMIDGKPYSTLKRHINRHGYTPETYRDAFGLPSSYPMVAEAYRAMRSDLSKTLGLGRKKNSEVAEFIDDAGQAAIETPKIEDKAAGRKLGLFSAKPAVSEPDGDKAPTNPKGVQDPTGAPTANRTPVNAGDEPKRTGWWSRPAK